MKTLKSIWIFAGLAIALCAHAQADQRSADPSLVVGPASILTQCIDPGPKNLFVGPSARARECTRQLCREPKFRAKVRAYAMRKPQSKEDDEDALTCITRWEQDQKRDGG
jgi:hypothetical protein